MPVRLAPALFLAALGVMLIAITSSGPVEGGVSTDPTPPNRVGVALTLTGSSFPPAFTVTLTPTGSSTSRTAMAPATSGGLIVFEDVESGSYQVALQVPANCTVQSANPVAITAELGNSFFAPFTVHCAPHSGHIALFNQTDSAPSNTTYTAIVDGQSRAFRPNTTENFDVPVGDRVVEITNVPPQCYMLDPNPRTVQVTLGSSQTLTYRIDCSRPRGTLRVRTRTTGALPDPDGYLVSVAGSVIGFANDFSHDFTLVPAGAHDVFLSDVAGNCRVSGAVQVDAGNFKKVGTVVGDQVVELEFAVDCPATGTIEVTVASSGSPVDPDGYELTVGSETRPVSVSAVERFDGLTAGSPVAVALADVAPNCVVAGDNPRVVSVVVNTVVPVTFNVTCLPTGTLEVRTTTTGVGIPPEGFTVKVAGVQTQVGANGSKRIPGLFAGDHQVLLVQAPEHCTVGAPNPRTVTILAEQTTPVAFSISCMNVVPHPAPVDPAGIWTFYVVVTTANGICTEVGGASATTVTITKSGAAPVWNVTARGFLGDPNNVLTGTFDERVNRLLVGGSYPEDRGTTTSSHSLVAISNNRMVGTETWDWSDHQGGTCPGSTSDVTAIRGP
jgi:hypothetical protein